MSDKILKDDPTKTITEKGAFTPKKNKSKINLGKGFGRLGIVGAGITAATIAGKKIKEMADEGKMPKTKNVLDRVTDVLNKAGEAYKDLGQAGLNVIRGNVGKKSMGGKIYKANEGMSASEYFGVEFKDTSSEEEKESNKKSAKALAKEVSKKSMGGDMKKGYGKARTSGMGLQDENITLGKGSDYIKDLL